MKILKINFLTTLFLCIISCKNSSSDSKNIKVYDTALAVQTKVNPAPDLKGSLKYFSNNYYLKNDSLELELSYDNRESKYSKFYLKVRGSGKMEHIDGVAELILVEETEGNFIVPEGTFILDKNTNDEYLCDSAYMFNSNRINVSFGAEIKTRKRLSLVIDHSKIEILKDNEYTLYKKDIE